MRKLRSNPVNRLANRLIGARARRSGGRAMGMNVLVLHTRGRKSGRARQSVVGCFPADTADSWLIAASAAGADCNPDWYHNLAAHPDSVTIEIGDSGPLPVACGILRGAERDEAWARITAAAPRFAQYEAKTDRLIPVVRLTRA